MLISIHEEAFAMKNVRQPGKSSAIHMLAATFVLKVG
jgi:hypothetical protein